MVEHEGQQALARKIGASPAQHWHKSLKEVNGLQMQEPKPDPKMSGRVAMIALLVAFGVVGMMLWIG